MRFFLLGLVMISQVFGNEPERWVVYYDDKASIEAFDPYSLVVLDSDYHPSIKALKEDGKTLLGYISLGEVEKERSWFQEVKDEGILLKENKNWPGSYFVDVRDRRWSKRVIEDIIPQILHKGFDGLFFDTLENAENLENENPGTYAGMADAAADLVKEIKRHYPNVPVMLNRAYFLLPKTAGILDMALGEDAMTTYDFKNKKYLMQPEEVYEEQVKRLKDAQKINPDLKVFTLDYWYPDQKDIIEKIYQTQRDKGFIPYVGTIDLDKIVPEPGR